jgi:hypothetical protein
MSVNSRSQKLPFQPPRLVVYGDVRDLTRTVANNSETLDQAKAGGNSDKTF